MNSCLTDEFFATYRRLPAEVREQARQAYALFAQDPGHPGLRFKKVHPTRPIYSARVGLDCRVVGVRDGDDIQWFWIGSHSEYDSLLRRM